MRTYADGTIKTVVFMRTRMFSIRTLCGLMWTRNEYNFYEVNHYCPANAGMFFANLNDFNELR